MPSTTSKGLPYPLGTDRVMDGDDQIRKLAQGVQNYVQSGTLAIPITAADTATNATLVFPVAYAAPPNVTATANTGPPSGNAYQAVWIGATTAADVVINAKRAGASAGFTVTWIAVGTIAAVA